MNVSAPATTGPAAHGEVMTTATLLLQRDRAWRFQLALLALGVALIVSIIVAASVGAVAVPLRSVAKILLHCAGVWASRASWSPTDATIVLDVRLPRVVT